MTIKKEKHKNNIKGQSRRGVCVVARINWHKEIQITKASD